MHNGELEPLILSIDLFSMGDTTDETVIQMILKANMAKTIVYPDDIHSAWNAIIDEVQHTGLLA